MNALDFRVKKSIRPATKIVPTANGTRSVNLTPTLSTRTLCLLSCTPADSNANLSPYAVNLSHLLGGRLSHLVLPEKDAVTAVQRAACHNHLVVLDEPEQSFAARLWLGPLGQKFAAQLATSVLIARQPLWPLHQLLLVLRLDGRDETAVFWTQRLAQASGAGVTILPLVPALPAMFAPRPNGVASLLTSQTAAGRQLRELTRGLNDAQVTAVLRLRQGEPGEQIRSEVESGSYDLVLLEAEPEAKWQRWLMSNLVIPLLSWIARPVLVAKPSLGLAGSI